MDFTGSSRRTSVTLRWLHFAASLALLAGSAARAETVHEVTVMNGARAVPATIVVPDGAGPFPAVVMNHGHGGGRQEGGGFTRLAKTLADAGILTIRMDFPGSGDSSESFTEGYLSNMISDSNASPAYLLQFPRPIRIGWAFWATAWAVASRSPSPARPATPTRPSACSPLPPIQARG